jgi:O-antigen ligase
MTLWAAALRIAGDHPWLGVGPDNYRHVYGPYAGLTEWDHRVHANNMYLDVLAGTGVPGVIALGWFVLSACVLLWRRTRATGTGPHIAAASALAMWVMVAGHGLVDSFLSFTTTYVTFAVGLGLACSPGLAATTEHSDAHRV